MLTLPNPIESELYKDFNNVAIITSLRYIAKMLPPEDREQLFAELEQSFDMRANMIIDQADSDVKPIVSEAIANVKPVIVNIIGHLRKQVQ